MPSGARQGWLIATGLMLALCLFFLWQSWLLPLTDKLGPGPGFFPFWLSLVGAIFSLLLLIGVLRRSMAEYEAADSQLPDGYGIRRIAAILASLAVATLLMDVLGFQLTMLGFNAILVVLLGERRWPVIAVFAVAGSFGVYYIFTRWLDVLLPPGVLDF